MRLLDTATIQVKEQGKDFDPTKVSPYAILSHTWEEDEVSLEDLQGPRDRIRTSKGYQKIESCCKQAAHDGLAYVWIDTCCIDKKNSSELSEAINSMFQWYGDAFVCYTFLADVYPVGCRSANGSSNPEDFFDQFRKSRWFTRGWTLQELIAPRSMVFFNRHWEDIGTKASLKDQISNVTGIPRPVLLNGRWSAKEELKVDQEGCWTRRPYSVAEIMSWAAKRRTTRQEDIAYCLLGLFDVNLPMIYGEGGKAFLRLQQEILKQSNDQSIFAWTKHLDHWGVLATSPSEFAQSGAIRRCSEATEFSLTNRGIRIRLPLIPVASDGLTPDTASFSGVISPVKWENFQLLYPSAGYVFGNSSSPSAEYVFGILSCELEDGTRLGICLGQDKDQAGNYVRVRSQELFKFSPSRKLEHLQELFITNITNPVAKPQEFDYNRRIVRCHVAPSSDIYLIDSYDQQSKLTSQMPITLSNYSSCIGYLFKHERSQITFAVIVGVEHFVVWSNIELAIGNETSLDSVLYTYRFPQPGNVIHARRAKAVTEGNDRITKIIDSNLMVKVAVKRTLSDGKEALALEVAAESIT